MSGEADPPRPRRISRLLSHGATRILAGSVVGQGILLGVSPLLTRLYDPRDFAALTAFTALATVLGGVITLSWDRAIVVPRTDAHARSLMIVGCGTVLMIGGVLVPLSLFLAPTLDAVFGTVVFESFAWLLPATVVVMGLFALMSSWIVRKRKFRTIASRNALLGSSQAASSVFLGLWQVGSVGLLSSMGVGRLIALVGMTPWRGGKGALRGQSALRIRLIVRRYRRFPLVATWSRVLNILGLQLPPLLIVSMYGPMEAGLYALTVRVLAAPIGMVVDAISQYFEGTFAARVRARSGSLVKLIASISGRLFLVGLIPAAILAIFAPELFAWAFGAQWRTAGDFARLVIAFYLVQLAISPVSRALLVLEQQTTQLLWDITRAIVSLACVVVPALMGGSLALSLALLTVAQVVLYGVLLFLCLRAARRAERR